MALNLNHMGKKMDIPDYTYDQDAVILYALGIGAGVKNELDFLYEKNLKVFPTFAVLASMDGLQNTFAPKAGCDMRYTLHGEQKIILHKPIPTRGTIRTSLVWDSVYDKGDKGAVANLTFTSRDEAGMVLFENKVVVVDRSAGNFGGDRGPIIEKLDPPKGQKPDFRVEETTSVNQAALYRLSGDKNILHIDPEFSAKGGFDRPILQGLCTLGFAGRALLHKACGGDPSRLKNIAVRFMNVVFPGDTLITEGWKVDPGKYIIRTTNQNGKIILGNAVAETIL